jgi:hypothetical protein
VTTLMQGAAHPDVFHIGQTVTDRQSIKLYLRAPPSIKSGKIIHG